MKTITNNIHINKGSILRLQELKKIMSQTFDLCDLKYKVTAERFKKETGKNLAETPKAWIEVQPDGSRCVFSLLHHKPDNKRHYYHDGSGFFKIKESVEAYPVAYLEPITRR